MEAWHSVLTHPQILPFTADANTRYDLYGDHINRAITPAGALSPHIKGKDQLYVIEKLGEFIGGGDARGRAQRHQDGRPEGLRRRRSDARAQDPGAGQPRGVRGAERP